VTGPVTALGIRDGDPDVLRALIARRGSAVLAYCERACPAAQVPDAAAEAFARFRALVVAAPRPADLDPEAALLSSTRHAAAERAPRGQAPPAGAGLGRLLGGRPTADAITLVPELLIARADGTLDAEGEEQLTRLLDASAAARAAEERFRTAEHAYRSAPPRPIPDDVVEHIVTAMAAVPAPPRPAAEEERDLVAASAGAAAAGGAVASSGARRGDPIAPPAASHETGGAESPPEAAAAVEPPLDRPPPDRPPPPPADEAPDQPPAPPAGEAPDRPPAPPAGEAPAAPLAEEAPDAGGGGTEGERGAGATAAQSGAEDGGDAPPPDDEPAEGPRDEATQEWTVPPEELAPEGSLDVEIAAARLHDPDGLEDDEATRIQTASGAVDEPLAEDEDEEPLGTAPPRGARGRGPASRAPAASGRGGVPGKGALAPAAAVVAVAAVSILATSGILGGDESQPPVDTGIAPKRSQVEVPEGEAAAVIDDLRRAADDARRQRLADKRGSAPAEPPPEEEPQAEAPAPAPEDQVEPAPEEEQPQEEPPADEPEAGAQEEPAPDEDTNGGAAEENAGEPRVDAPAGETAP
jgi:hypothetical protein